MNEMRYDFDDYLRALSPAVQTRHIDADESIFFARQLEHIKTQVWEIVYAEMKARDLIPVSTVADPADTSITYDQYDKTGLARVVRDYANDFSRIDVSGKQYTAKVVSLGDGFGYTIQELRASRKTGKPLDQKRASAAQEAARRLENRFAWLGNADDNQYGLLSHPNINHFSVPADGTGASTLWTAKTPLQILRDLNLVANYAFVITKGIEVSNTMLFSHAAWVMVNTTPLSNLATTTIMDFFRKSNPQITHVDYIPELDTDATSPVTALQSHDSIVAYTRDPMKLTMEIPQDFEMFPPVQKGMEFQVACHSRWGGLLLYKPLCVTRGDSII